MEREMEFKKNLQNNGRAGVPHSPVLVQGFSIRGHIWTGRVTGTNYTILA